MNSYSSKILFSLFLLTSVGIFSCKKKTVTDTTATCTSTISYATDIKPLVDQNCSTSGCHNSGSSAGGYNLTTYASVSSNANIILKTMRHSSGVQAMPQGSSKLASSTTDQFDCWIQQGTLNN